jgi:hypothetical protein
LEDGSNEDGEGRFLFKTVEDAVVTAHIDSFQARLKVG